MRICLLVSLMFFFLNTYSQKPLFDQYRSDTIHLEKIYFKKLVSYQTESVTFLVDYGDFKDRLNGFWKNYHKQIKNLEKTTREKNSADENALRVIDSVY